MFSAVQTHRTVILNLKRCEYGVKH